MKYYHGTVVENLKTLKPFASPFSNIKKACVYLSTNKALSLVYIWDKPYMWMTFRIREDGIPVYEESFPNSLKEFYKGVRGYVYTCHGEYSVKNGTGISCAAVSEEPVPITECEVIEDVYEKFLEYERNGDLIIDRFENLSKEQREANERMVLNCIKGLNLLEGKHPLSGFVKETFPHLWSKYEKNLNIEKI